jgi:hypothetical protein
MIHPSLFLRRAIVADAIVSGAMALLLTFDAEMLAPLLNLPEALLRETGLFLIAYAALVGWLGTRSSMPKLLVAHRDRRQCGLDAGQHRAVVLRRGHAEPAGRSLCRGPGDRGRRLRRTAIYRAAQKRQRGDGLIVIEAKQSRT